MKKGIVIGALAGGLTLGAAAAQAATVEVANGAQLKAAIEDANSDASVTKILCKSSKACDVVGTLPTYSGAHTLIIDGRGSTIDGSAVTDTDVFASVGGGTLKLIRLNFLGGLSGVYVEVPAERTGNQRVEFRKVTVRDAILHGGFVSDPNRAPAGIKLVVFKSSFTDNGVTEVDQDGLYVEETGAGAVIGQVTDSSFLRNGSDGLGISETGGGKVDFVVSGSDFRENGENIGSPDDPDDGFDIDEGGFGDLILTAVNSRFIANFDDGLDLDERGVGHLLVTTTNVKANLNIDQGMTFDERDDGDLDVELIDSKVANNDQESQKINLRADEGGAGTGTLTLNNTSVNNVWLRQVDLMTVP